ncbi:ankyrin repeat, SAM and basic leucine zipper domain-containing protein 1-like [Mercenaria mercenaria]|uniref:ankyrin repeat, SAM and basic leucine zipper domain-containing protein 1-like n=1 Tax=Mercenaria mercenaria TaxID=6596 RepID=UPI00234FA6CB|nr:ankyrin repeat, SAM and basic leucine zipper domain-containing protein 1-like [Mercenaria mercenaria]
MALSFRPGGYEDEDDDFDGDGFYLSGNADGDNLKPKPFDPTASSGDAAATGPRGGFGKPSAPKKREPVKTYKRASDLRDEAETRPLNIGDFQMAIVRGHSDRVKQYMDLGFKVDTELKSGWTGLMYAANNANSDIVKLLLDSGANPNFQKDMYTVLMAACGAGGYLEDDVLAVVELLLGKGAEVNAYDRYHTSPIMYAAREGRDKVVQKLCEAGANVNKQDNRGWTALTWSVSKKHKDAARCLLSWKADPRMKHCNGQTVIDMAETNSNYEMLEILEGKKREHTMAEPVIQANSRSSSQLQDTSSKESYSTTYGTTYGDLELFLCGLDLSYLVDVVRGHQIDFSTFLRLTEEDLVKMGIDKLGVRKKILDGIHSVHKKEWEKSSLPQLQYNKQISCAEALAVVANISKHTKYITSTVGFLQDQIKSNPKILDQLQDGTGPKQLFQHTQDTLRNVSSLEKQFQSLKIHLQKTLENGNYNPPDLLDKDSPCKLKRRSRLPVFVAVATTVAVIVWKRDFLWNKLEKLLPSS